MLPKKGGKKPEVKFGQVEEAAPVPLRADCVDLAPSEEGDELVVPQTVEITQLCHFNIHVKSRM